MHSKHRTARMCRITRITMLGAAMALAGCGRGETRLTAPDAVARTDAASEGAIANVTGSGHHSRIVGGVEELTTFSFAAVQHKDGTASGQYQYNFRANGFSIHGPVTCVTRSGNQVWVGGIVERVVTDNPAFAELAGLEMWWRSIDNGEGANAAPDVTTGVGFGFAGSTITAASWCRNQPLSLVARVVEDGNIQVR